jgi:hypothetical protein
MVKQCIELENVYQPSGVLKHPPQLVFLAKKSI